MKKSVKTLAATLLAGIMAFGAINANAMSPKDQDALGKAKITAAQALSTAQTKIGADAKIKSIDFKHHYFGKDHFEVEMFANGQKQKVAVDAASGDILGVESKALKTVKVSPTADIAPQVNFAQAMDTAVAKTGGKVAEADLEYKRGMVFYKIETVNNGVVYKVAVDANSGQIIDMPQKHEGKHHKHARFEKGERHKHPQNEGGFRQN
ncbi:MAG: PepSY domain-containing protein [Haemophilus parahaemolyticus]|uniref:PepSY domain-containing protein n=1 Tax=Haemophilus parahaemolyticus TaxID=735 RepID=UPI0026E9FCFE|nr:PepSY domain-containing protein [Haemophilus parahaemolyticus]MBS6008261.1 PepSY domain-containing protein [Haemophilus parahaemolyticus]